MQKTLEEISGQLSEIHSELKSYCSTLNFEQICEFTMDNCQDMPWERLSTPGIYQIEIKNISTFTDFTSWVGNFRAEWEDSMYKRKFVPNLKMKRIKQHTELKDWIPLYIGKSKSIRGRVHQHIYSEIEKTTFALKLNARVHAKKEVFRLSIIPIPHANYNWIVPVIENTLRDQLNPIIGKQ